MLTEYDAHAAVANRSILATDTDHGQVIGQALNIDTDGETITVRLVADGVNTWVDILDLEPTSGLARCGRCSKIVTADSISTTGPYLTCPPCTDIIRS